MPQSDQDVLLAAIDFEIEPVREANYEADEIFVEFRPGARWQGSDILWHLKARILLSLHPPEQDWDAYKETFSNIAEPGTFRTRAMELDALSEEGELAHSLRGEYAHQTHRRNLAERSINGEATRALCGVFFIPMQDHETLPECPVCRQRLDESVIFARSGSRA